MALPTVFKLMELEDVKIAKLVSDEGTAPTYEAAVDVPGITKVTIGPKAETKKLFGDSALLDVYQKTTEIEITVESAMMSLDVLKVILGGNVTLSGVSPNQKQTYSLTAANSTPPFFKIEGRWLYAGEGIGDAHFILYKCKVIDPPEFEIEDASGNFGKCKFKASAVPCQSNGQWFDVVLNETAEPIA